MKTVRKPVDAARHSAHPALTVNVEIDPLVAVVRRHVKLSAQATRLIKSDLARLFEAPAVDAGIRKAARARQGTATDPVLSTQAAADLIGVSRPYLVARIDAGDIPLHQQVGNQRRVLQSAVLAWHRGEQARRRKALGQLGVELDREIFPDLAPR